MVPECNEHPKLVPQDPRVLAAAGKARRVLFWVILGVVVLNILLFLKFGLNREAPRNTQPAATNARSAGVVHLRQDVTERPAQSR